jgi:peptide/nickel transport system substrate-binding protein
VRTVRDETTRVLELMHGRADLVVSGISPQLLGVLRSAPGLAVETVSGTGHAYLALNLRDKTLADVRVRRALSCALDRAELAEFKFEGTATPATGLLPKNNWAYAPEPVCDNDPAQARKLLDEAGFPDPGRGRPRLVLSLKSSTDRFRKSVAGVIAAQVARAGIQLDLRSLEFGTFSRDVKEGSFQVATLKWSAVLEPDLLRWAYDSKYVPTAENHFEGLNRQAYRSASFDARVEAATAGDATARAAAYAQAQAQLAADLPTIPLWHEDVVVVRSRALQGFRPSPHGFLGGLATARLVAP